MFPHNDKIVSIGALILQLTTIGGLIMHGGLFLRRGFSIVLVALILGSFLSLWLTQRNTHVAHAATNSGFVTRSGTQLQLNGSIFRFSGANAFGLILNGSSSSANTCTDGAHCAYESNFRIDDHMAEAQELGETVLRSEGVGSINCTLCLQPTVNNYNPKMFERLDYTIASADKHGIRLFLPLVTQYHNYMGGIHDWVNPTVSVDSGANPTSAEQQSFYGDATIIGEFESYFNTVANHVNQYNGLKYKDDPAVLAWELGNEMPGETVSWATTISAYIKSVDPNHLIGDAGYIDADHLAIPNVDLYTVHAYPAGLDFVNQYAALSAQANKAFFIGEYDWQASDGTPLKDFLSGIESNTNIAGDIFWTLWAHADDYGPYWKGLGVDSGWNTLYTGTDSSHQTGVQLLRKHAYAMQGITTIPADSIPGTPVITSVDGNQIFWRGTAVAENYSVERSTTGADGSWVVVCNQCATDYQTPWTDGTQPTGSTSYYRVRAYNLSNQPGPYSPVYQTTPNLAAGATFIASSSVENTSYGWGLQFVNDGQRNSTPSSSLGWISSSNTSSDHTETLSLNLGTTQTVGSVVLYPRNDSGFVGTDFPANFEIDVSTNGSNWTSVVTKNSYAAPTSGKPQVFTFAAQTAQYVRVVGNSLPGNDGGTYRMAFAEVEVYAPVNLALGASATASSSAENTSYGWGLQFVNDGQRNSTPSSSLGWISSDNTSSNHTESLMFDFGGGRSVTRVDLYPRNDSGVVGANFPIDFTIAVSTDGNNWTNVVTQTGYASPTNGAVQRFSFTTQTAVYVRIQGTNLANNGDGTYRMAFAEVEIS